MKEEFITVGDVSTAFLTSPAYDADSPKRYVGYRQYKGGALRIYELLGSVYGQKDASQRFYESLRDHLLSQGFTQSKNDVCLYVRGSLRIGTHVDDVIARGTKADSEWFWSMMTAKYALKSWNYVAAGQPAIYCGLHITMRRDGGDTIYCIDQNADVAAFLADHIQNGIRPLKAPMANKQAMYEDETEVSQVQTKWFRSGLMSISWFACQTRFDLSHTVSRLAQKMAKPTVSAVNALKRVLAYMTYRPEFTLSVVRAKRTDEWKLYTDSDHAGDAPTTSKSHTGTIFFLNGMAVHWKSKKQPITALSSAAAEVYAFSEADKEANSLLWRAEEAGIKVKWPINIFEDNKATISFQQSAQPSTKLKGVYNLRWHWVLELRDTNKYMATKVATDQNIADLLTKCYKPHEMERMLRLCRMV